MTLGRYSLSLCLLALCVNQAAAAPAAHKVLDTAGAVHQVGATAAPGMAVVFLSTECPISNRYVPTLNRLAKEFRERGVPLYGVVSDATTTRRRAAEFAEEFRLEFPLLFDASGALAKAYRPTHVPEAFVLDHEGEVVYRGRIDNRWAEVGRERTVITKHDLRDALAAVAEGETPATRKTEPVGCYFEVPPEDVKSAKVTYARDIAPILQANCVKCHREGEVAPFPLTSYEDAAKRARWIAEVTRTRLMPPWKIAPNFGHFKDERRLSDDEIALLAAWSEAGAPKGDPADLPPPREFPEGWQLGEPDLVLEMPEAFTVPADGKDIYQHFVLPVELPENVMVQAVEFQAGNPGVVHHAIFYLDKSGRARKLDAQEPGPGYSRFGNPGFSPSGTLGGWAPGLVPRRSPEGTGRPLAKQCDFVMQIHYHPSGKAETDRSRVALYFAKEPVEHRIRTKFVINHRLAIPPGKKRFRVTADYTVPVDVELLSVLPHMHLLGQEMKVVAKLPDGTTEPIVWVTDWDWNWQGQYHYVEPLFLPAGTELELEAFYDNSANNPANPNSPPQLVKWGPQTTDEMCVCFFELIVHKPRATSGE